MNYEDDEIFKYTEDKFHDETLFINNIFDDVLYKSTISILKFSYGDNLYEPDDPLYPNVGNGILGDYNSLRSTPDLLSDWGNTSKENEMSIGTNIIFPSYQETGEKSAKEENKVFLSTLPASNEMNGVTNNMLPSNQETVKKSAKEENKESFSTPLSSKKKCKNKKEKIFIISKKLKIEKIRRKRSHYIDGKHNKFAYDNMTRKLKTHLFESILVLLNASLRKGVVENPKKNSKKLILIGPFFVKISQKIIRETNVKDNQDLCKTKIKDIFSKVVSEKYKKHNNQKLIEKIYKEKIKIKAIQILERTFLDCLKHFRKSEEYKELAGLEKEYDNVIDQLRNKGESEEYIEKFKEFVGRFEEYYKNKKPRKLKES